eukprot:5128303-Alexandrium_andersonii.AAC.1
MKQSRDLPACFSRSRKAREACDMARGSGRERDRCTPSAAQSWCCVSAMRAERPAISSWLLLLVVSGKSLSLIHI